jgi:hypothetical protein
MRLPGLPALEAQPLQPQHLWDSSICTSGV